MLRPTSSSAALEELSRLYNEISVLTRSLQKEKAALERAQTKIEQLNGLLPICSACKKIRDDQGYWQRVEEYLWHHAGTEFTHSYCPECLEKLMEDCSS